MCMHIVINRYQPFIPAFPSYTILFFFDVSGYKVYFGCMAILNHLKKRMHLQDEENLTKDQIEAEIKKIKEANADDEGMGFYYL